MAKKEEKNVAQKESINFRGTCYIFLSLALWFVQAMIFSSFQDKLTLTTKNIVLGFTLNLSMNLFLYKGCWKNWNPETISDRAVKYLKDTLA